MQTGLVAAVVGLVVLVDAAVFFWLFRRSGFFQKMTVEAVVQPETWIAYVRGGAAYAGAAKEMTPVAGMLRDDLGIEPLAGFALYLDDMAALANGKGGSPRKVTGCVLSKEDAARVPEVTNGFWLARLPQTDARMVCFPQQQGKLSALAGFRAVSALNRRLKTERLPFRTVMEMYHPDPPEMRYLCLLDIPQEHLDALYDACK